MERAHAQKGDSPSTVDSQPGAAREEVSPGEDAPTRRGLLVVLVGDLERMEVRSGCWPGEVFIPVAAQDPTRTTRVTVSIEKKKNTTSSIACACKEKTTRMRNKKQVMGGTVENNGASERPLPSSPLFSWFRRTRRNQDASMSRSPHTYSRITEVRDVA